MTVSTDQVHVWQTHLSPSASQLAHLQTILSPDEMARAERFNFPQHRQAFIAARGVLRRILSRYVQSPPQSLEFGQGPHGKPFLSTPTTPRIKFNVSHSHDIALYAVALDREVGIDIEYHRPNLDYRALIQRICSKQENSALSSLSSHELEKGFLACWTRKEAYVKATGKGITTDLQSITVSVPPSKIVTLVHVDGEEEAISRWAMDEIIIGPDYTAALVVGGLHACETSYWAWSWDIGESESTVRD